MSIYFVALVDELQDIWKGIEVVDNLKKRHHKMFNLRVILIWTMHDYLGYVDVRKYSV